MNDWNTLRNQVLAIATDVAALKTQANGLQVKDAEHDTKFLGVDATLESLQEGVKSVEASVLLLTAGHAATNTDVAVIKTAVGTMQAMLVTVQSRLTILEASIPQQPPTTPVPTTSQNALYVPLFIYPGTAGLTQWQKVADIKKKYPALEVVACANPSNGIFTTADPGFVKGIDLLAAVGVIVIGYVYTKYGNQAERTEQSIKDNIVNWKKVYGITKVTGIFFDEMHPNLPAYYKRLTDFAKAEGFKVVWGNPGSAIEEPAVGCVDTILIYENKGVPTVEELDVRTFAAKKYPISNFGMIPHTVPTLDKAWLAEARKRCKYVYVTPDVMMNPWDTLPPWLDELAGILATPF